ncbi:MAG: protein translocase subunit SecF [Acidobacteriota bacterium]|nr:MAG: protein translocase subunit SecF [Acidobacteriota bacterium]
MFDFFSNINVNWMGIRKPLIAISIVVLLAGLVSAISRQLTPGGTDAFNLGVDFQGGTVITAKFKGDRPTDDQIRDSLEAVGLDETVIQASLDKTDEVLIKVPLLEGEADATSDGATAPGTTAQEPAGNSDTRENVPANSAANASTAQNASANTDAAMAANTNGDSNANSNSETNANSSANSDATAGAQADDSLNQVSAGPALVRRALDTFGKEALPNLNLDADPDAKYKIVGIDSVGPVAGEQLRNQAVIATLLGMVGILLFIAFRYDWTYAAGAVIAVFHDVLITLAFFTMFQWEISLTVLAALLTLVGFSVNDSIVIFDRIRENLTLKRTQPIFDLTNDSINQTMSRTIVTNGLVFLSVLALVLFGGQVLRGFSLALFVGAITGTYSTIAIASPIAIWWQDKLGEARMKESKLDKEQKLASAARRSVSRRPVSE